MHFFAYSGLRLKFKTSTWPIKSFFLVHSNCQFFVRWNILLHRQDSSTSRFSSLPVLRFAVDYFLYTPSFPHCRPYLPFNIAPFFRNLFSAVDALPWTFDFCHISVSLCLHLPLYALLCHTLSTPLFFLHLPCSIDLQSLRPLLAIISSYTMLQPIVFNFISPTKSFLDQLWSKKKRIFRLLRNNQPIFQLFANAHFIATPGILPTIIAENYFSSSSSPLTALDTFRDSLIALPPSQAHLSMLCTMSLIKVYKALVLGEPSTKSTTHRLYFQPNWKTFWDLQIPLTARNI